MNNKIPLKFLLLAASFHALNALIPFLSMFVIWSLLLLTRKLHPFIDQCGKNALNFSLNTLLILIVLSFLHGLLAFLMIAVVGAGLLFFPPAATFGNQISLALDNPILFNFVAFPYFTYAMMLGAFALTGRNYKSRLIYSFIKDK
jgi:uncharacterized Tic20 family protein